jgi:hypothetical protein
MARTVEQILQEQVGAMVLQMASLTARLEAVTEELAAVKAAKKEPGDGT